MILNGREALTAGKDDYTSEDEPEDNTDGYQFQTKADRSENMRFFLESKINSH